jgi:hypothetical protein
MYVWSGSAWVSVASEVESLATYATQSYANNAADVASGMKLLTPTSIAVGSGSGSVSSTGTVNFSGSSSVSLNDVFSSTYTHYLILTDVIGSTTNTDVAMRLRVAGADNSSTQYRRQRVYGSGTTVGADRATGQTSWSGITYAENTTRMAMQLWVANPFTTLTTTALCVNGGTPQGNLDVITTHFTNDAATSYPGFTIFVGSGTITGTVSVYGYKK